MVGSPHTPALTTGRRSHLSQTTMLRHLLASLVLLVAPAPLAASPNDFDLAADCTIGVAGGDWNLPLGDQPGNVRGFLVDRAGRKLGFEGVLTPVRTMPNGVVRGRLDGALYPLKKDDKFHPKALAEVTGRWVSGPAGRGRFRAAIAEVQKGNGNGNGNGNGGNAEQAVAASGKVAGQFLDLRSETLGLDPVGAFTCRWTICR